MDQVTQIQLMLWFAFIAVIVIYNAFWVCRCFNFPFCRRSTVTYERGIYTVQGNNNYTLDANNRWVHIREGHYMSNPVNQVLVHDPAVLVEGTV